MKIAFDISPLLDNNKNRGVGKYTDKLLELLKKEENLEVLKFHQGEKIPKTDLVHYPYFDPFFLTLPLFKKYPTIVTVHDLIPLVFPKEFPRGLKGELKWKIQKLSLQSVKSIITDSESSKKDIVKFTGINSDQIQVIYLAPLLTDIKISDQEIKDFKAKLHLPDKFLLYVGDINYNKNIPALYRAISLLGKQIPLVLVGKAFIEKNLKEKQELDNLAEELKISDRLIKVGTVSNKELAILYLLAKALIYPSLYEGFGLPVLDAMVLGCPVVTSNRGSLPEIVGDTATIVNPDAPEDVAEGIKKVINWSEAEKNSTIELAKRKATNFSWENTTRETIKIYNSLLQENE